MADNAVSTTSMSTDDEAIIRLGRDLNRAVRMAVTALVDDAYDRGHISSDGVRELGLQLEARADELRAWADARDGVIDTQ